MNIVYLDAHAIDPENTLDWSALHALGHLKTYENTGQDFVERCSDADVIITNKIRIGAAQLAKMPNLKYIQVSATGYNIIDLEAAKRSGIKVANVPAYSTSGTAQHTWALILAATNRVGQLNADVRTLWPQSRDFCYGHQHIFELKGKTLGIIGLGAIGEQVATIAEAFGMQVIYTSRSEKKRSGFVDLDQLCSRSDIISLHIPQTTQNVGFIDLPFLKKCKPSMMLINTARGGLINEADLNTALKNKTITFAALDTLSTEPPSVENPLLSAPNCLITPHVAWGSIEARQRLINAMVANIAAFKENKTLNIVNL